MSEDRLDKALEAMGSENVTPEELAAARARVWEKLGVSGQAACSEFKPALADYHEGRLAGNRRLLMEDHLSRCTRCRAELAVLKGERKVTPLPIRSARSWPKWGTWAAAAALAFMVLYAGRDRIDTLLAPGGPRATVATLSGGMYRLSGGPLQTGAEIGEGEVIRTGPGARAVLRLADGSMMEVNERTELSVRSAWSGQAVHLQRGDIIVQAAKQRGGHLRVQTRDSLASVKGTVFSVSAGLSGTVVSVVEGSVAVTQPGVQATLGPGEQAASNPALENSVPAAIAWSSEAERYMELLASFSRIEKQLAGLDQTGLRTQSGLLQYLPANTVVFGAIPNIGGTIHQALMLFEQQSAENPTFRDWWNSAAGQDVRRVIDKIQTVTQFLGEEIVFCLSNPVAGSKHEIPMVLAEVQPGKGAELIDALNALGGTSGAPPFTLSNNLFIASESQADLQLLLSHLGQDAASPFAAAIASRYERGAVWLIGLNLEAIVPYSENASEAALVGAPQMKHLFLEQRGSQGAEENEVTLTFRGQRMGMASWLADSGSGGAAEYLPGEAVIAAYASTREPRQLFEELMAQIAGSDPSFQGDLSEVESRLGAGFVNNLVAAFGTESAFAIEGLSLTGPVWVMAALVNDPATVDISVRKLVDLANAEIQTEAPEKQIAIEQETVDGRAWSTLKSAASPLSVTWTFDRGYLVAASDRGAATRAIATRNGGSPLIWSPAFQQQLPSSAGLHPSAFAWLNTKGAFQGFAALIPSPGLQKLLTERDPILVVFNGTTEQIHAASRTRISGLIVDLMLLESLSRGGLGRLGGTLP
jgi:hypothetical protein